MKRKEKHMELIKELKEDLAFTERLRESEIGQMIINWYKEKTPYILTAIKARLAESNEFNISVHDDEWYESMRGKGELITYMRAFTYTTPNQTLGWFMFHKLDDKYCDIDNDIEHYKEAIATGEERLNLKLKDDYLYDVEIEDDCGARYDILSNGKIDDVLRIIEQKGEDVWATRIYIYNENGKYIECVFDYEFTEMLYE